MKRIHMCLPPWALPCCTYAASNRVKKGNKKWLLRVEFFVLSTRQNVSHYHTWLSIWLIFITIIEIIILESGVIYFKFKMCYATLKTRTGVWIFSSFVQSSKLSLSVVHERWVNSYMPFILHQSLLLLNTKENILVQGMTDELFWWTWYTF